jgi:hypothetical protein
MTMPCRASISRLSWLWLASRLVTLLPLFLTACASYYGRPFLDERDAASLVDHREVEGLHVAVIDLSSARRSAKHFDRELASYGFVPVMLLMELDASSNDAFNVRRRDVKLRLRDGTELVADDPLDVVETVSFSHLRSVFSYFMILPGFFVASSVNEANEELEEDYVKKALQSVRISPNLRAYKGVVFFRLPEEHWDDFTMEDAFIDMTVYREGQEGNILGKPLEFPVHFAR